MLIKLPSKIALPLLVTLFLARPGYGQMADTKTYLADLKTELVKRWPKNRTVNLVFHGHSVPSGYFTGGNVNTVESYPYLTLKLVKEVYPKAVMNAITTSIGGEQAVQGARRFKKEVFAHRPDVIFIDYALNDRSVGLEAARKAWVKMIRQAQRQGVPVVLLTPSPDTTEDLFSDDTPLARHTAQIKALAAEYNTGLVDSYGAFRNAVRNGTPLKTLMAQNNHPNAAGHALIAQEIIAFFQE